MKSSLDELIKMLAGMKGGLMKSANLGTGRDPASGQLKTVEKMLDMAKKIKNNKSF